MRYYQDETNTHNLQIIPDLKKITKSQNYMTKDDDRSILADKRKDT